MRPSFTAQIGRYAFLVLGALITLVPLGAVAVTALFPPGTPVSGLSFPSHLNWGTFAYAWENGGFAESFATTFIVAAGAVSVVIVCSCLSGYALAILRFRGRTVMRITFLTGIVAPYVALIIPLYFQLQSLGLLQTRWGLVIVEAGLYLGFGIFWMQSFIQKLPKSLFEAAYTDGANSFQAFLRVVLPLSRPALATLAILTFLSSWNEYLVPLVLGNSAGTSTVSLSLASFQGQFSTDIPSLAAASLIIAGPAVILFLLTQRSFFRGLLAGAVK